MIIDNRRLQLGEFDQTAMEATEVTAENLQDSLNKIKRRHNLNEQQFQDLIGWATERLNSLRNIDPKQAAAEGDRRTGEYRAIKESMTDNQMAAYVYISADGRARELAESHRLNPYLLTKGGMKKELRSRMENIATNPNKILVLVAFDLDDFKMVNDLYGHHEGDTLLMAMGKALDVAMRSNGLAAHYSGDEFGFVLEIDTKDKNMNAEKIREIVKRMIREIIEEMQPMVPRPPNKNGAIEAQEFSAGFRIIKSKETIDIDEAMKNADKASSTSKILKSLRKGKNGSAASSTERVVDFSNQQEELANYTQEEIRKAELMNRLRRPIHEAYPNLGLEELTEMIISSIALFEVSNQLQDVDIDEIEEEVKKLIKNLLRAQKDNEASQKFFTKGDKNTPKSFSGTKKMSSIYQQGDIYRPQDDETQV